LLSCLLHSRTSTRRHLCSPSLRSIPSSASSPLLYSPSTLSPLTTLSNVDDSNAILSRTLRVVLNMPWPVSLCEICVLIPAFIVTDLADRPQRQRDALVLLVLLLSSLTARDARCFLMSAPRFLPGTQARTLFQLTIPPDRLQPCVADSRHLCCCCHCCSRYHRFQMCSAPIPWTMSHQDLAHHSTSSQAGHCDI